MATGDIKLGQVGGTLYAFPLHGGPARGRKRFLANPQSTKIGRGIRKYEDDIDWDYWHLTDWQAGLGQTEPDTPGMSYGEVDSRVPNQLIISPQWEAYTTIDKTASSSVKATEAGIWDPSQATGYTTIKVGLGTNFEKIAFQIMPNTDTSDGVRYISSVTLALRMPYGGQVRVAIWEQSAGAPDSETSSYRNLTLTPGMDGFTWYTWNFTTEHALSDGSGNVGHYIVVGPTSPQTKMIEILCSTNLPTDIDSTKRRTYTYANSAWTQVSSGWYPFFMMGLRNYDNTNPNISDVAYGNVDNKFLGMTHDGMFAIAHEMNGSVYHHAIAVHDSDSWDYLSTKETNAFDSSVTPNGASWNGVGYFPWSSTYYLRMTYSSGWSSAVDSAYGAHGFTVAGGYLWRWIDNNLYYTADSNPTASADWAGPYQVCSDDYAILGVAEMDGNTYVACSDGLYWFAPGDFVQPMFPWPEQTGSGKHLISYNNTLYFISGGAVWSYSANGQVMSQWMTRADDLPSERFGEVIAIGGMNNWLLAMVEPTENHLPYSLLAYQSGGWHYIAQVPRWIEQIEAIDYDRDLGRIVCAGYGPRSVEITINDAAINPYYDSDSVYMPSAWYETPWFEGAIVSQDKDFDSVFIVSEGLDSDTTVDILWRTENDSSWQNLATVSSDNTETRWTDYTDRPKEVKRFKLALRLWTSDPSVTLRIKAIVVKFLTNVADKYGWSLRLLVDPDAELSDGTLMKDQSTDVDTMAKINTFLDTLESQPYAFILEDIDGRQFEVRQTGEAVESVVDYRNELGTRSYRAVRDWTVKQLTEGTYP